MRVILRKTIVTYLMHAFELTKRSREFDRNVHFINSVWFFKSVVSKHENIQWQKQRVMFVPKKEIHYTKQ